MAATDEYGKEAFYYDKKKDVYICPQGQLLFKYRARKNSKYKDHSRYANQLACANCSVKEKCTQGKYRTVCDRPLQEYAREVDKRTKGNMEMYHKRKELVEFGTVKRGLGYTYFLSRGTESVRAESCMHFLIYNIKRAMITIGK